MEQMTGAAHPEPAREGMRSVLTTREPERLHLCSLVLSAADIRHTIGAAPGGGWMILVPGDSAALAEGEINAYDRENSDWPLQPPPADTFAPYFRAQAILIVASLMLFSAVTGPWSPHSLWFSHGAVDSTRVIAGGEYYRLLTGLTLHADLVHLLGNCFLGGFLLHFYFLLVGNGLGITTLLATACLANYVNVLAHGPGHLSVGFSTAVFAVIGILSALNYRHYRFTRPARIVLPLMAGAAMLAMLGSGDETGRTDLGAHFFGLMAGLACGTLLGIEQVFRLRQRGWLQLLLALLSTSAVIFAWQIAMQ